MAAVLPSSRTPLVRSMTLCREYCQAAIAPCRIIADAGMSAGGAMSRTMVGLLSAAGAVVAALVGGTGGWMEAVSDRFRWYCYRTSSLPGSAAFKKNHPASDIRQYQKLSATIPAASLPGLTDRCVNQGRFPVLAIGRTRSAGVEAGGHGVLVTGNKGGPEAARTALPWATVAPCRRHRPAQSQAPIDGSWTAMSTGMPRPTRIWNRRPSALT